MLEQWWAVLRSRIRISLMMHEEQCYTRELPTVSNKPYIFDRRDTDMPLKCERIMLRTNVIIYRYRRKAPTNNAQIRPSKYVTSSQDLATNIATNIHGVSKLQVPKSCTVCVRSHFARALVHLNSACWPLWIWMPVRRCIMAFFQCIRLDSGDYLPETLLISIFGSAQSTQQIWMLVLCHHHR